MPSPSAAQSGVVRSGGGAGWALASLLVLALMVLAAPFWAPAVSGVLPWGKQATTSSALADRVAALERRPSPGTDLAERLARLEERGSGAAVPQELLDRVGKLEQQASGSGDSPDNAARLQRIEQGLAAVEQRAAASPPLADRVARLEQRTEADPAAIRAAQEEARRTASALQLLEQRLTALDQRERAENSADRADQALLVALTQLRQAVVTARPFATELGAAAALAGARAEIGEALAALQPYAAKGIPTVTMLSQQFPAVAADVVRAEQAPPSDNLGEQVMAKLRSLVTVRRVGQGAVERGAEATVAAAEQALAEGDLGGAVAALETLTGAPAEAARSWLDQARARLAAEGALNKANGLALARVAQDGSRK